MERPVGRSPSVSNFRTSLSFYKKPRENGTNARFFYTSAARAGTRVGYQNLLIKMETESLLKAYESRGIPSIPLKGTRFSQKYFGHIAARGTSDIDLLVPENEMSKAIQAAHDLGYELILHQSGHYHITLVKSSDKLPEPLELELHYHILDQKTCSIHVGSLWSSSVPSGEYVWVREMPVMQTFYLICLHGMKHRMDSLKFILDIVQMIELHADEIDYAMLLEQAKEDQTKSRIIAALSIVYECFPHLKGIKPCVFAAHVPFWSYAMIRQLNKKDNLSKRLFNKLFPLLFMDTWSHRFYYCKNILSMRRS